MMKYIIKGYSPAYLLPATIMLGLAIAIIGGMFLRFTAMSSQTLNAQNYNAIAEEAARSGIAFADSCISQGKTWPAAPTPKPLFPNTTCEGDLSAGSKYITVNGTEWRSTFSVAPANAQNIVISTGIVEVINSSGVKLATYEKKLNMSAQAAYDYLDTSTGFSITDIKNDESDCAIANGKLYCWGSNEHGQLGLGTKTTFWSNQNRSNPSLVGGALSGKTVTKLSVGSHTACVIADGSPYCWGDNNDGALGTGSGTGEILTPTDNVPRTFSGPLQGKKVIDIGTAAQNTPFPIWPFSTAVPHSCALTEDGAMSCWGDNRFRAISGPRKIVLRLFMPMYDFDHNRLAPTLVDGYVSGHTISNSPLAGKKAERIGVSSHDSCALAQGRMYCMGVEVPLPLLCGTFGPGVAFSGDWQTVIPLNGCVANNSAGYDMSSKRHGITGYTLNNKNIDPNSFDVSANLGCMMAQRSFVCVGVGPGMGGGGWGGSFYPPWIEPINGKIYDVDVTSHDNGDNKDSGSVDGLYCVIDRGVVYCQGTSWPGNYLPAAGNQWDFGPVSTSYGLAGKAPTKVAAGKQHGCIVANGQLFCWGNGAKGVRANGDSSASASNSSIVPKLTGIAGPPETDIGTTEGTHAATGPIDTGDKHGCAAVNGHIYCWGNNDYGQLGTGNRMSSTRPTSVNFPKSYNSVTKISVGKDHSCAIVEGNLYCWGNNEDGKLGTGTGPSSPSYTASPVKIDIASNARVTDVSAGTSGTCAVAEGRAYCWGKNDKAQLGTGDKDSKDTPTLVSAASPNPTIETNSLADKAVTSISLGQEHACAVANGDLYCWGNNSNGRNGLGSSNATGESLPTLLTLGTAGRPKGPNNMTPLVTSVSAGKDFTCAIINAKVSCWGDNTGGKTGRDTETSNIYEPTALTGAAASYYATTISAGDSHACALLHGDNSQTNGNIFCWRDNTNGQLGRGYSGNTPPDHMVAMRVSSAAGSDMRDSSIGGEVRSAINISVGSQSSCTIANAVILCWGDNTSGQLGTGDIAPSAIPRITSKYQTPSSSYASGPIF